MPELSIEKWNASEDGEINASNMKKKLEKQGYHCSQYTFTSGTDFPSHTHSVTKKDAIVSGRFLFGMYGREVVLTPGDMIEVPLGELHYARVVGSEPVTFFDSTK